MQWFRMYSKFATDLVVQSLAFEDQRHFVVLLCLKCEGILDRKIPKANRDRLIYRGLGLDSHAGEEVKARLLETRLIDKNWQPVNWDKLQFAGDSSTKRVKGYRERREALGLPADSSGYRRHWSMLAEMHGEKCAYCLSTSNLCIDHIYPVSLGGTDDFDNLTIACKACNSGKAGRTPAQCGYSIKIDSVRQRFDLYRERNGYESVPRARSTEADTEAEADISPTANAVVVDRRSAPTTECPATEIVNLYHETLPTAPRIAKLTPARRQQIRARWQDGNQDLDGWRRFFEFVSESDFLMGRCPPRNGSSVAFQADLEWLTKAANWTKVIEGRYHRE